MPAIRVLTHNVKMLPGPFGHGDEDLVRARALCEELGARYDVVALQEVFDEEAREVFDEAFKRLGYATVPKVDDRDLFQEDSGLFFATKLPLSTFAFEEFEASCVPDSFADKGIFGAQLRIEGGSIIVLNSHLQSSLGDVDIRKDQLKQMRAFVLRTLARRRASITAVIGLGDFNVVGETSEHARMLSHLGDPRDAYRVCSDEPGYTWDGTENRNMIPEGDRDRQRLDYVLVWDAVPLGEDARPVPLRRVEIEAASVVKYGTTTTRLSDHFGVEAQLVVR